MSRSLTELGRQLALPQTHLRFRTTSIYPRVSAPKGIRGILHGPKVRRNRREKGTREWWLGGEVITGVPPGLGMLGEGKTLPRFPSLGRGGGGGSPWGAPHRGRPGAGEGRTRWKGCVQKTFRRLAATLRGRPPRLWPRVVPLPDQPTRRPCPASPAGPGSLDAGSGRRAHEAAEAAVQQHLHARARRSLPAPARGAGGARGPSPGAQAGGRARGELRAPLCCLWRPCTAQRAQPAPGAERRPRLLLLSLPLPSSAASPRPPPVPPSLPLSEHSMSERSEDDVGAFSNPVSLGCCCRRNREKATRRKSNGDTGSQSAQSGGVSGQTLVLLDRRRQITLLRQ